MSKRQICSGCDRPASVCLCSAISRVTPALQLIIWQDKDEARHRLSTAPLLHKSIVGSRLLVADQLVPEELLGPDWRAQTMLLFPLEHKPALTNEQLLDDQGLPQRQQLLLLDGTWRKVKRLLLLNPWLNELPHLALQPEQTSRYAPVRKSPRDDGLSTLEAAVIALNQLHPQQDFTPVTRVLERLVYLQLQQRQQQSQQ
ncbi:tRNA-uridine aminocarboxypropyltransferase [Oceanobacter mangrovi]|uniref:tRNA-uridine aminocarboxypropyltransferase n=1 Tax=Oceanobacter mangrovi TaxID=2862510 RepID=UPI001C8F0085|nr:tRNA-uridine aminocarboxypropyltransferase [Oceanobacter mangrovi]